MARIFPSLISADLMNLQKEIERLDPLVPGYHLDVMDFHFVPNLTWGPAFIRAISANTAKTLWVHLMVDNPKKWVDILELAPGSIASFHIETNKVINETIMAIQDKGWLPSIAINPKTNISEAFPYLGSIYQVLLMSVEPGHSGQQFLEDTVLKLDHLIEYRNQHNLQFRIAMDGGISEKNIRQLAQKGVDDFGVANALFAKPDAINALKELQTLATL